MPEAEPVPGGSAEDRDGSPAAVADFAGLDVDETVGAPVASFDDVGGSFTDAVPDVGGAGGSAAVQTVSLDDLSDDGEGEDGGHVRVASFGGRQPTTGRSSRPRPERKRTSARRTTTPAGDVAKAAEVSKAAEAAEAAGIARPDGDGSAPPARPEPDAEPDTAPARDGRSRRGRGTRPDSGSRGRGGAGLAFSPPDDEARAKEICLRLLTDRARTVQELSQALRRKEIPDEVAQRVLERFDEVGLVDDEAFAGQWVRSRHRQRGLGRRAIAAELHRKGVAKEIADEALTEIDAESEQARARELVDRKLRTVPIATKEQRVTAARRLVGMLARKGYGGSIAYGVVREAIAARGVEEDELGEGPLDD